MTSETTAKKNVQKLQRVIVDGLEDVKGQDIQVFNTEGMSPLFERVIVASGTSNRQTKALAASVRDAVREAGFDKPRMEGEDNGEWIIVDCGPAVVHVMQPSIRQYYRLEDIWGEKPVRMKHGESKPRMARAESAASLSAAPVAGKRVAAKRAAATAQAAPAAGRKAAANTGASKSGASKTAGKAVGKVAGKAVGKAAAKTTAKRPAKSVSKPTRATTAKAPVPLVKVGAAAKKPAAKKPVAKKPVSSKAPASQSAASKAPAKKTAAKTAARKATSASTAKRSSAA